MYMYKQRKTLLFHTNHKTDFKAPEKEKTNIETEDNWIEKHQICASKQKM